MPLTQFVPHIPFSEYSEKLKEHFVMERDASGVIEVRFHTKGGVARLSTELHRAIPQMFRYVGQDPENQCMILTGTGDHWLYGIDEESFNAFENDPEVFRQNVYDNWYLDGTRMCEHVLWGRDFPIISVINGPGFHTEFGLLCDLTIASDDAIFRERHFQGGLVPGDGMFLVYQHLLGTKRAAYAMYMRPEGIKAKEALDWGLVNELHPREKLMPRAREMAKLLLEQRRVVRQLTQEVVRRPWKKLFTEDFALHFAHECFAAATQAPSHKANHTKYKNYE